MRVKKIGLCVATLAMPLSAVASDLNGSFSGMSNAAYATGNYSEGVLLNPSLGAAYNPEKDDFALVLGLGALVSDQSDMLSQADDITSIFDDIDNSGEISSEQADELLPLLEDIDGDYASVDVGANIVLSIPNHFASVALIAKSTAAISVQANVSDDDLDLIADYADGVLPGEDFDEDDLTSTIRGHGAIVTDVGVSISKAFQLQDGSNVLVGATPKKTEVESIIYSAQVANFDEDDFDADEYTRKDSATNLDLGVTYIRNKMHYALVANNLMSNSFETIIPNEKIEIERQLVAATGYVSGNFKAEFALDLNAVQAIGRNAETQIMRAGVEYSPWDLLRLRAGMQNDLEGTLEDTVSLGLGLGVFNLTYIHGSDNTEGVALSGGLRF